MLRKELRRAVLAALAALSIACTGTSTGTSPDSTSPKTDGSSTVDASKNHGDLKTPAPDATIADAGKGDAVATRCGDGKCQSGETVSNCPADCSAAPTIWSPRPGTSWQWQLTGKLDTTLKVKMYDIDLFDNSASTIAAIKKNGAAVICYFSAGSYEAWRSDAKTIPSAARGKKMSGWDELWLDVRHSGVHAVMLKRLDLAKSKGCDGVEPDNVDGYTNDTGFPLKGADQLAYNRLLAKEAHKRGLSIGLKNDVDQAAQLVGDFDWALNEECVKYKECSRLSPFIKAGKAVFHVEYTPTNKGTVCGTTKPLSFDSMIKKMNLDAWLDRC